MAGKKDSVKSKLLAHLQNEHRRDRKRTKSKNRGNDDFYFRKGD